MSKNEIPFEKWDTINHINADSVEDYINQLRDILLEKEKSIPEGIPHTIKSLFTAIRWDYLDYLRD